MIIEYSNAKEPKSHTQLSLVIVLASCAFFFIPTTLIVLGYLSSQPTGTLVSPLPQGALSDVGAQRAASTAPTSSPTPIRELTSENRDLPIIAAPGDASSSAPANVSQIAGSNIIDKVASVSAGLTEIVVSDADIKPSSQIYLSPRPNDNAVYAVKSKGDGQMTIQVNPAADLVRYVDYHIVNP